MCYSAVMASITIRNLDDETKRRLRIQAAEKGRSMEEEARVILQQGAKSGAEAPGFAEAGEAIQGLPSTLEKRPTPRRGLGDFIHERFKALGGVELELPERRSQREPPDFSGPEYGE